MIFNKRKHSPLVMRGGFGNSGNSFSPLGFEGKLFRELTAPIKPTMIEMFRLMPDGILFGSAFFALLSQSFAMAIFVVSMVETGGIAILLQKLLTYMDLGTTLPNPTDELGKCSSAIFGPSLETLMTFSRSAVQSAFPSFPIFFMSTAAAYIVGSLWSQKRELEALGPEYAARFYIAVVTTAILLFATMTYRLVYACDGVGTMLVSAILGFVLGGLLVYQNNYLLGRDSTNFSGIPLLVERTKDGKPLYVCTGKNKA